MQPRQAHLDALKFLGAQLIAWHHLAVYGPLADALHRALPGLGDWLYDQARWAVQIFLVIGGYLAAQQLQGQQSRSSLLPLLGRRYRRLVLPLLAALALAVACAALARPWLDGDIVPAPATATQLLAHALLLQDILGIEVLSAGVWYVAIDFQLYALLALLLHAGWCSRLGPRLAVPLVLGVMAASLLLFNRLPGLDAWAPYFFGSYGLGVAAWWAQRARRPTRVLAALALLGALALALEPRARIAVALLVALLLGWLGLRQRPADPVPPARWERILHHGGSKAYALFLVHFPVLLLVNASYAGLAAPQDDAASLGVALAAYWLASMALAWSFARWVEAPLLRVRPLAGSSASIQASASREPQSTSPRRRSRGRPCGSIR